MIENQFVNLTFKVRGLEMIQFYAYENILSELIFMKSQIQFFDAWDTCSEGYFPRHYFQWDILNKLILKWTNQMEKNGLIPIFQNTKVQELLRYKIATCHMHTDSLHLLIAIPCRYKEKSASQLYQYKLIPIKLKGILYYLDVPQDHLLIEQDNVLYSTSTYEKYCLDDQAISLSGCMIRPMDLSIISKSSCLSKLWSGSTIQLFKHSCDLLQITGLTPQWINYNTSTWIYTGDEREMELKCQNSVKYIRLGNNLSTSLIQVPCKCSLKLKNDPFYITNDFCEWNQNPIAITLHSFHYIPYSDLYFPGASFISPFQFRINESLLNTSLRISDHDSSLKLLRKNMKLLEDPVPEIEWTSPFHSTWYYLIILIFIILIIIGIIWFYKSTHRSSLVRGTALLTAPIGVRAETDIPLFVDTLFILLCSLIILSILYIIYREVRYIRRRFQCHNLKSTQMSEIPGPHIDLLIDYNGSILSIAIKSLPNYAYCYHPYQCHGTVTANDGELILSKFDPIQDYANNFLQINGYYRIPQSISFAESNGMLRLF